MQEHTQLQELSDEELYLVAGGYDGTNVTQVNAILTEQKATAQGIIAVALNVAVVTPINVSTPVTVIIK